MLAAVLGGIGSAHAWVGIGDVWGVPVVEINTDLGTRADLGGADGSWRGRMSLEPGRNKFIIVVVTPEGFSGALTKSVVVREDRRKGSKR